MRVHGVAVRTRGMQSPYRTRSAHTANLGVASCGALMQRDDALGGSSRSGPCALRERDHGRRI
ncbi:hypothetical protein J2X52_001939 [Luteimonas sp. 3794]|nr:hypothetical protein [Luteimonas sp. 3794]